MKLRHGQLAAYLRIAGLLSLAMAVWLWAPAAMATSVETLLMPGKVAKAHIKQETTCTNCHDRTLVRKQS